ncbi:MAG: HAMP domain-containing protein [Spirochaetaceae bacterium]|jgi:adenylate cyclase|nr:HAMP domain-containing protein [Spirochaetaceae bacterium]
MVQNDGLQVYYGLISLEDMRATHRRILERAEAIEASTSIGGIPAEEVRRTHFRIIAKAEALRYADKKEWPEEKNTSVDYQDTDRYAVSDEDSGVYGEPLVLPESPADAKTEILEEVRPQYKLEEGWNNGAGQAGQPEFPDEPMPGGEPSSIVCGEAVAGEAATGEAATGEAATGEAGAGEAATGEAVAGEAATGEAVGGEAGAGEAGAGEAGAGEAVSGEAVGGEAVAGEAGAGEVVAGEAATGVAVARPKGARRTRQTAMVRLPIAVKLVGIVTILLMLSLGTLTALVSILVSADVRLTAEDNNFSVNRRTAEAVQTRLRGIGAAAALFYNDLAAVMLTFGSASEETVNKEARYFFAQNPQIAAIVIDDSDYYINETFFVNYSIDTNMPRLWNETDGSELAGILQGKVLLRNATPVFGIPMAVMRLPLGSSTVNVFFDSGTLNAMLGEGYNTSFLLNERGDVILHKDFDVLRRGANFYQLPFVKNILDNLSQNIQSVYTDEDGVKYFGAVQRLNIGTSVLITIIRAGTVFDGIVKTTTRNITLSIVVLLVSIIFIVLFSKTISKPLRSLTNAVQKIEEGNYDLHLKVTSNDELGLLTQNFIDMGNNLENFEKFTNKTIVKLAKQGRLSRSGENKKTTVGFVFIRNFDEVSDGLDAETIVDFVNDYLQMMVPCITRNGGSVDKFLTQGGVIIMALWGTPETAGSPKQDALNCMRAVLSMRAALRCLNKNRVRKLGRHIPLIRLGCGINTGEIVAGQIGSEERMEYTVIGDAVNLAARIEGPNDLFDTDILISEETYKYVGDYLLTKEMQSIEVKGKEKPLRIFAVVNMRDPMIGKDMLDDLKNFNGIDIEVCKKSIGPEGPRNISDVRERWQIDT